MQRAGDDCHTPTTTRSVRLSFWQSDISKYRSAEGDDEDQAGAVPTIRGPDEM